jgi:hypothetical protein
MRSNLFIREQACPNPDRTSMTLIFLLAPRSFLHPILRLPCPVIPVMSATLFFRPCGMPVATQSRCVVVGPARGVGL